MTKKIMFPLAEKTGKDFKAGDEVLPSGVVKK